jgi:hypothetical protein
MMMMIMVVAAVVVVVTMMMMMVCEFIYKYVVYIFIVILKPCSYTLSKCHLLIFSLELE